LDFWVFLNILALTENQSRPIPRSWSTIKIAPTAATQKAMPGVAFQKRPMAQPSESMARLHKKMRNGFARVTVSFPIRDLLKSPAGTGILDFVVSD
jgi:hypothetical protein